jgi:hypothetical protein
MTRTNVMASSRPQTADTAATRSGSSRARRGLVILPVALALAVAPAAPVLAANGTATSNYSTPPPKPTTTPSPNSGTSPSKSTKSPANTVSPATTSSTPTTSKAGASTLPFTGFDLRWTVGAGLLLVGAGGSIMVMQRRQRRDTGR